MKTNKIVVFVMAFFVITINAQTHHRKTRSDKGKSHSHTTKYYVKKALTPKPTKTKKKK